MNEEWSRCPICFEEYSSTHRPTTFACGHSTCIDHTVGSQRLRYCTLTGGAFSQFSSHPRSLGPICRHKLNDHEAYHVSYGLEEAACLLQQVKDMIDWSIVKRISAPTTGPDLNSDLAAGQQDEMYARRLQAEFDREALARPPARAEPSASQPPVVAGPRSGSAQPERDLASGHAKRCGHHCDMLSTTRCCTCSGKTSILKDNCQQQHCTLLASLLR